MSTGSAERQVLRILDSTLAHNDPETIEFGRNDSVHNVLSRSRYANQLDPNGQINIFNPGSSDPIRLVATSLMWEYFPDGGEIRYEKPKSDDSRRSIAFNVTRGHAIMSNKISGKNTAAAAIERNTAVGNSEQTNTITD